jgi:hypothetical protein
VKNEEFFKRENEFIEKIFFRGCGGKLKKSRGQILHLPPDFIHHLLPFVHQIMHSVLCTVQALPVPLRGTSDI